ncbi:protein YIF1A [Helianthus annuus]|uniref:protein YIF1A n=1 Tax=Helianthus annuus TaxID=4232 RepID=UPI000B8F0CA6|nr:protein YIF1A [Helianthus annuus]
MEKNRRQRLRNKRVLGFLGHWTRITEPVGVRLAYKPPIYDINAPYLYISLMALYVVLAGFSLGLQGKFIPEALNWFFMKGIVGCFLQVSLLKMSLFSLDGAEAPLLDIVAYAGYAFTGLCLAVLGRIIVSYSYYILMPWTCLCMRIFLVKTMKRVPFSEVRSFDSSRHQYHYLLLFIALAQFPLFIWLGNITLNWLF